MLFGGIIMYIFKNINGHIEVYSDDEFLFAADNLAEAEEELKSEEYKK